MVAHAQLRIVNHKQIIMNGYNVTFIDWYNHQGLFFFLSLNIGKELGQHLTWWSITNDYYPRYISADPTGEGKTLLSVEGCRDLKERMIKAKRILDSKETFYHYKEKNKIPITNNLDIAKYKNWLDQLINFLDKAININSPVEWSV